MPYTIRDFSKICGVSAFNIRYYEKRGFPLADRSDRGYRQYEIEDAYRFNTFNALLSQGFSVSEAVERLDPNETREYITALDRNNRKFEEELWLLEKKLAWNRMMQKIVQDLDHELEVRHEVDVPEMCFLPCTDGLDLTPSLMLERTISEWVALLPASQYAAYERKGRYSLGMVVERKIAQARGLESEHTVILPGGTYYSLLIRGENPKAEWEDSRLQGLIVQDERLHIFLMTNIAGYGENMNYLLLKKT